MNTKEWWGESKYQTRKYRLLVKAVKRKKNRQGRGRERRKGIAYASYPCFDCAILQLSSRFHSPADCSLVFFITNEMRQKLILLSPEHVCICLPNTPLLLLSFSSPVMWFLFQLASTTTKKLHYLLKM